MFELMEKIKDKKRDANVSTFVFEYLLQNNRDLQAIFFIFHPAIFVKIVIIILSHIIGFSHVILKTVTEIENTGRINNFV